VQGCLDSLYSQRVAFEDAYGRELSSERLDNRKASRIADYSLGAVEHSEEHGVYLDWFIDAGDRMRQALAAVPIQ